MANRSPSETVLVPPSLASITALKISALYAAAGALWILFSDHAVDSLAFDTLTLTRLQTAKGWFFVAVTAALLYLVVYRAVTSLERSRGELIRQKIRMEEASRAARVALWEWDLRTGVRNWTEVVDSLLGYGPGDLPRTNDAWEAIIHPEDLPRVTALLKRHIERYEPYDIDYRVMKRDKTYVWWRDSGVCQRDEKGEAHRMVGACLDVTEQKRAEQARQKSEERFRFVADNVGELIWEVDPAGLYRYCSAAAEKILGYSPGELVGRRHFYDLFAPDVRDVLRDAAQKAIERRQPFRNLANPNVRKDGGIVILETNGVPILDEKGTLLGYGGVDVDITERSRAEDALRRQNAYLEALHETTLGLMRRMDLAELFQTIVVRATRFSRADEGWISLYEPRRDDFEYKAAIGPIAARIGMHFEPGHGIAGQIWRTNRPLLIDDYHSWPHRSYGAVYDARRATVGIPLRSEDRLAGVLALSHYDPGRRFEADEVAMLERFAELASLALDNALLTAQMKEELAERKRMEAERDLIQARLLQSQKMEALGTLAGGVAHDLNNVLGVLVGYSELLLEKIPDPSPLRTYVRNILQSGLRGGAIIQDLLTLARRGVAISEVVDLNRVITDYFKTPEFEMLRVNHPDVRFRNDLAVNLRCIKGSPIHLGKTIMNLTSNAAEAITGRGEVVIRTENRYLDQPVRGYGEVRQGEYVVLTVSDDGRGIAEKDIAKIFEPFYTKKVMGRSGTGLGLAVVWGTVTDHDGYIDVQSEENRGSVFTLYFPATPEEPAQAREAPTRETYRGRGESILVVDDVKEQREVAMRMLERLGYQVTAVSGGEEAVNYLKREPADLVLLDMIMDPGIDGLETYRRIAAIRPGQKAVIVSGYSETDRVSEAQQLGAGAYVRKPYVLEKIGTAIRTELDRR
ncbi:MAG: PAS domain-containing protein [Syntrophales bacterium]